MLIGSLVKATVELQGFRVMHVAGNADGLVATLGPDRRYAPRCGRCHEPARYRDTRRIRHFRHVPIWGVAVALRYAPRRVSCSRCAGGGGARAFGNRRSYRNTAGTRSVTAISKR